jgi:hypothetical protein
MSYHNWSVVTLSKMRLKFSQLSSLLLRQAPNWSYKYVACFVPEACNSKDRSARKRLMVYYSYSNSNDRCFTPLPLNIMRTARLLRIVTLCDLCCTKRSLAFVNYCWWMLITIIKEDGTGGQIVKHAFVRSFLLSHSFSLPIENERNELNNRFTNQGSWVASWYQWT